MADVPASVGWFSVSGRLLLGLADSDDAGNSPDAVSAVADVIITNNAPVPLVAATEGVMFKVADVHATLDTEGRLRPPANGLDGTPSPNSTEVFLVAPNQASIHEVGWWYTFTFVPRAGQTWETFSIQVTGEPGDTKNLASEVVAGNVSTSARQPTVWVQDGTALPAAIQPGQFLLDTSDSMLYLYQ